MYRYARPTAAPAAKWNEPPLSLITIAMAAPSAQPVRATCVENFRSDKPETSKIAMAGGIIAANQSKNKISDWSNRMSPKKVPTPTNIIVAGK